MIIVGGPDAALTAMQYAKICEGYYPVKGVITTNMKVKSYTEDIMPDFIAERNEYELDFKASLSVMTVVRCAFAAGIEFIKNSRNK